MTKESIVAILLSLSPFGEAKVGIPYGMLNGVNIYIVFITCFLANVLVFPLMMFFLEKINAYLLRWNFYKKSAIFVARRAKNGSGDKIKKYGFWGLMFFVMIPLPGTGSISAFFIFFVHPAANDLSLSLRVLLFKIEVTKL